MNRIARPHRRLPPGAAGRWVTFRGQLGFHLAAENTTVWLPARAGLAGDPHDQALLDALDDEQQLIVPDDAFTMGARPERLRRLPARLQTRLASHLAHEEADALPLIATTMSTRELARITRAIGGGYRVRRAAVTIPWALDCADPWVRARVLAELPAPARLLHRRVWLPRDTRHDQPLRTPSPSPAARTGSPSR